MTNTLQYNMQDPVYIQYPSDDEKERSSEQTEEYSCKQHLPICLFIIEVTPGVDRRIVIS